MTDAAVVTSATVECHEPTAPSGAPGAALDDLAQHCLVLGLPLLLQPPVADEAAVQLPAQVPLVPRQPVEQVRRQRTSRGYDWARRS